MSEGIQKLTGKGLRNTLTQMTSNRFRSLLSGVLTTAAVQSSSATSVLVVSFVNAGFLSLRQAIGLLFGANIGTTIKALLLVSFGFANFELSTLALPFMAIGFPLILRKGSNTRFWGEFLVGFSLFVIGLQFLKSSVPTPDVSTLTFFQDLPSNFAIKGALLVLFGAVVTGIIQSSSAAFALLLVLAQKGIISYELGAAFVIGINIGTTVTAQIAAIVANKQAKRAALSHMVFNVIGAVWMAPILGVFLSFIDLVMENTLGFSAYGSPNGVNWGLTLFHILFNVLNGLVLIWFTEPIEELVRYLLPKKPGEDDSYKLEYMDSGVLKAPELALLEAYKRATKFGVLISKIPPVVNKLLTESDEKKQKSIRQRVKEFEQQTDAAEQEISQYLKRLSQDEISVTATSKVRSLLSIISDLESIGDVYWQIAKVFRRKTENRIYFLPDQRLALMEMQEIIGHAMHAMISNLQGEGNKIDLESARNIEQQIKQKRDELKEIHLSGLSSGEFNTASGMVYSELYGAYDKISDHILRVSTALEKAK